jgi:hypothetical protein
MRRKLSASQRMEEKNSGEPLMTAENKNQILLTEESGDIHYQNRPCLLTLTSLTILIEGTQKKPTVESIPLNGLIGATISKEGKGAGKTLELHLFAFPQKGCLSCCCSSPSTRKISTKQLLFSDPLSCSNWMNAINSILRDLPLIRSEEDGSIQAPPSRRYLVFVNPVGGTGIAVQIWNRIRPFLSQASIEFELLITERANHAKDVMATRDLDGITAVVIVGGDGLIFEVVSGLFARSDAKEQLQRLVFAPIPGGSGNGLIKSILHESGEEYAPENAVFVAIRGKPAPLDLSQVTIHPSSHPPSLLLIGPPL